MAQNLRTNHALTVRKAMTTTEVSAEAVLQEAWIPSRPNVPYSVCFLRVKWLHTRAMEATLALGKSQMFVRPQWVVQIGLHTRSPKSYYFPD